MGKIKVSEAFYSIQGEGVYTGTPSVFLRTFGCNFRCPKFGMDHATKIKDHKNPEVVKVIKKIDKYKTVEELPLVATGCDSYMSVYPEFKGMHPMIEVNDLAKQLTDLIPSKKWYSSDTGQHTHLVITGGEPLLPGWQKQYPELLNALRTDRNGLYHVTFETNGTQMMSEELSDYLIKSDFDVLFSVSPKLSVSGEAWEDAIQPEVVKTYRSCGETALKFVVGSEKDMVEVCQAVEEYRKHGIYSKVFLMPVGGNATDQFYLTEKEVALLAMEYGFSFSPRLQVNLFKNSWGT